MASCIPIVDFAKLALNKDEGELNTNDFLAVGEAIHRAFEEIGFVYLKNHGIPDDTIAETHGTWKQFFSLPAAEKEKYAKLDYRVENQGYVGSNKERLDFHNKYRSEIRESYDITDLEGTFPAEEISEIRPITAHLAELGLCLAFRLLEAIEVSFGLRQGTLLSCHDKGLGDQSLMRILHYPTILPDTEEGTTRCGMHTDYGTFTLLFQDTIGGLDVLDRSGIWRPAIPIPGTILVNVGDLLQRWTDDKFIATEHRVVIPAEEIKKRCSRHSIVIFFNPRKDVIVYPFNGSTRYKPVSVEHHFAKKYKSTYQY